ncbi:hypothetical protein [Candidatus Allofournierella excrementavium]|uniref:hypothetical protein n=1 Tax=Candidatus Allofournierella excrementavium TaxID=2838591 RepID=UPI003AB7D7E4
MGDYIERKAAFDAAQEHFCDSARTLEAIETLPAADVRLVVRGRWIKTPSDIGTIDVERCSICGCEMNERNQFLDAPFCPNCGADMRGGDEDGE